MEKFWVQLLKLFTLHSSSSKGLIIGNWSTLLDLLSVQIGSLEGLSLKCKLLNFFFIVDKFTLLTQSVIKPIWFFRGAVWHRKDSNLWNYLIGILRKNEMKKNPFAKNQPFGDISTVMLRWLRPRGREAYIASFDHLRFLGNSPPTPPLSEH